MTAPRDCLAPGHTRQIELRNAAVSAALPVA
jgi:hypothetical protein